MINFPRGGGVGYYGPNIYFTGYNQKFGANGHSSINEEGMFLHATRILDDFSYNYFDRQSCWPAKSTSNTNYYKFSTAS